MTVAATAYMWAIRGYDVACVLVTHQWPYITSVLKNFPLKHRDTVATIGWHISNSDVRCLTRYVVELVTSHDRVSYISSSSHMYVYVVFVLYVCGYMRDLLVDISGKNWMVGMIVWWLGKVAPVLYQVQGGTREAGGELTRVSGMWLFNQLCMAVEDAVFTSAPDKRWSNPT